MVSRLIVAILGGCVTIEVTLAAIPEPDVILYGSALVNGVPAVQRDAVLLIARLPSGQEIGRFDFADCNGNGVHDACELSCQAPGCSGVVGCGTARDASPADGLLDDCPGNLYSLRVRCEATPAGVTASGMAAVLDPSNPTAVRVFMQIGTGPEQYVRDLLISERGKIRRLAASILNLFAFRDLAQCQGGPGASATGGSCSAESFLAADYDDDGDVDLRDYAFMQCHLVAP